jgi:hypothetical protein
VPSLSPGIPEEVELMANELVRTCAKHRVALTAFAFREALGEAKPFIFHFGTIDDKGENLRKTHDTLLDFLDRSGVERKTLYKNDA